MLAHNIGATRDLPSRWNEPKPTDIAPLAAIIPAADRPSATPAMRQTAIATVHGNEVRARVCAQSAAKLSRSAFRSISEHIVRAAAACRINCA
jgi:hypothetical protein